MILFLYGPSAASGTPALATFKSQRNCNIHQTFGPYDDAIQGQASLPVVVTGCYHGELQSKISLSCFNSKLSNPYSIQPFPTAWIVGSGCVNTTPARGLFR